MVAYFFYYHSDDTPLGNLSQLPGLLLERESNNHPNTTTAVDSFRRGMINLNSWILCWQYATCCGVDFTMCNGTALYYHAQHPDWSVASTAAVAGLYSMAALYARGVGGWLSDTAAVANMKWGRSDDGHTSESMRGRLWAQCLCLLLQGICNILLARTDAAFMNLAMLVVFSIFVQMSMGTCFGIVPYVDGLYTGSVRLEGVAVVVIHTVSCVHNPHNKRYYYLFNTIRWPVWWGREGMWVRHSLR
jgi:NNP family nitrate/nitrite transporter-like MFS transporter